MKKMTCLVLVLFVLSVSVPVWGQGNAERISIDFQNTDIREVLRAISKQFNVNVVPDKDVQGEVTIHLENVPVEQALRMVLEPNGYTLEKKQGIYRVHTKRENPYVHVEDGRLTIHADNADLNEIMRSISTQGQRNIVFSKPIDRKITVHMNRVPLDEGINRMLVDHGLRVQRKDNVYRIGPVKPPYTVEYEDGKLSIRADGAKLKELAREISMKTGKNILVDENIDKRVTISIRESSFQTAMDAMLKVFGLEMAPYRNVWRVYKKSRGFKMPISLEEGKLTLDVQGGKLGEVIQQLAERGGYNLVMYSPMNQKVTAKFEGMDFVEGMDLLFENTNYDFRIMGDLMVTGRVGTNNPESDFFLKKKRVDLDYIKVNEFISHLPDGVPRNHVETLQKQNALIVTGTKEMVEQVESLEEELDRKVPQIAIDVTAVEVSKDHGRDLGLLEFSAQEDEGQVDFTPSDGNLSLQYSGVGQLAEQFDVQLQALQSEGLVEIKANPTITTMSGKPANINVGSEDFFRVTIPSGNAEVPLSKIEKIPSGIALNIVPWAGMESDQITVDLKAEVSSASGRSSTQELPTISTRKAETELTLEAGKTLVIGGLINNRQSSTENQTPLLGEIPGLGHLFGKSSQSKSTSELIFYITPRFAENGTQQALNPASIAPSDTTTSP